MSTLGSITDIDAHIEQHVASIKHEACLARVQVSASCRMIALRRSGICAHWAEGSMLRLHKSLQVQTDAHTTSFETFKDLAQQREMQADTLLKAGKTHDAIDMLGKSLELLVRLYGQESAQAAPMLINMATAMQRLKAFDEAEAKVCRGCVTVYIFERRSLRSTVRLRVAMLEPHDSGLFDMAVILGFRSLHLCFASLPGLSVHVCLSGIYIFLSHDLGVALQLMVESTKSAVYGSPSSAAKTPWR